MRYLSGKIVAFGFMAMVAAGTASAAQQRADDSARADSRETLDVTINYDDVTGLLKNIVLVTGQSTRERAADIKSNIGTRFKAKRNVYTAYEGNRFYAAALEEEDAYEVVKQIRMSLEKVLDKTPITQLSTNEQVAYWLNLHNVAFLEELMRHSQNNMQELLYGEDSMLDRKFITIRDTSISLNDIRYNILARSLSHEPLIIYGLYEGVIGGPNIRKEAFTGETLYAQLAANATEFINSNRGTYLKGGRTVRVSSLYERYNMFFPDFQKDLKAHLLSYLYQGRVRNNIERASFLKPDVDDWTVASVRGNTRDYGGALQTNGSALATAQMSGINDVPVNIASTLVTDMADVAENHMRFSPEQLKMLMQLNRQRANRTGNVNIEEIQEPRNRTAGEGAQRPEPEPEDDEGGQ
ncbi:DUF547 domain-containing protein [Kordiimonas aestuarii]|uniref:DUF547 domain-containing protein n=1 Tax=Kordiimonas aestuarii TaxID=1005925 RepID=UPI0021D099C1|nr:DUF547 domain-containing protein [Kordiimonas aestuarii]